MAVDHKLAQFTLPSNHWCSSWRIQWLQLSVGWLSQLNTEYNKFTLPMQHCIGKFEISYTRFFVWINFLIKTILHGFDYKQENLCKLRVSVFAINQTSEWSQERNRERERTKKIVNDNSTTAPKCTNWLGCLCIRAEFTQIEYKHNTHIHMVLWPICKLYCSYFIHTFFFTTYTNTHLFWWFVHGRRI